MSQPSLTTTPAAGPATGGGGALPRGRRFGTERLFRFLSTAAGSTVLVIIVAIAIFLIVKAIPSLRADTESFFSYQSWFADSSPPKFGIAAIAFGTVVTSAL